MGRLQQIIRIARATRLSINAYPAPPCCIPVRLPDSSPSSTLTPLPRAFPELCTPSSHNTKSQATHILPLFRTYASEATTRHTDFSSLNAADVDYFRSVIGEAGVVQDVDALESANQDWIGKYKGSSKILLRPETTAQVGISPSTPYTSVSRGSDDVAERATDRHLCLRRSVNYRPTENEVL